MAKVRYRVTVYGQRCGGTVYRYAAHASVRPGKVPRLIDEVAYDVLRHECRGEYTGSVVRFGTGATIRVYGPEGYSKFAVRAARL